MNTWSVKEKLKPLKNKILLYSSGMTMSDRSQRSMNKMIKELQEELKMEKDENDLYMELLDVSNPEEAKERFDTMRKLMKNLEERNKILEERVFWNEKNYIERIRKLEGFDDDN